MTAMKKSDLQNNICQSVDPSKDLTIKPPKLRAHAPRTVSYTHLRAHETR